MCTTILDEMSAAEGSCGQAMRPQACTEPLFRTTLRDTVTEEVTVLHHQSKYIQVWTGGELKQRFRLTRRAF